MQYHDSHGRKRTAETALDDPTCLEAPLRKSPAKAAAAQQMPSSVAPLHPPPSSEHQPRKVLAPGATKAAIARLSALKAERGTPPPPTKKPMAPVATKPAAAAVATNNTSSAHRPKPKPKPVSAKPAAAAAAAAAPSGTKVLAPGATQAALARLGSRGSISTSGGPIISSSVPPPVSTQVATAPVPTTIAAPSHHHHPPSSISNGPKKVLAPGATQAALARLASFKSSGGHPSGAAPAIPDSHSHHHQQQQHHHAGLPPPPHPLFSNGGGAGNARPPFASLAAATVAVPFTATALDFSHGTVVWAKMQSYPWWPAQVQQPSPDQMRLRHSSSDIFIVFYGTADYSWLPLSELKLFRANLPEYSKFAAPRNKSLQRAIDEAWVSVGQPRPDVFGKMAVQPVPSTHHGNHHGW